MKRSMAGNEAFAFDIAQQVRLLRERQKYSQETLAKASGLSRNTLSLIERGQTSPTLDTLQRIADGLNVDIGALFQEVSRQSPVKDREDIDSNGAASELPSEKGSYKIDGLISALILRLEPQASCGSLLPHCGEEFIYCLSGQCRFSIDQQNHILEPGDSLRFDGRLPHYCQNPGQETAKALVIFLDMT